MHAERYRVGNSREVGRGVALALRCQHQLQVVVVHLPAFLHRQCFGQRLACRDKHRASVADGGTVHNQFGTVRVRLVVNDQVVPTILVDGRIIAQIERHISRFA